MMGMGMLGGMMGGGGGGGGAGNDVSQGAMSALNTKSGLNFAPQAYAPEQPNPALAPRAQQPAQAQPDQLDQMINKLLGVWVDRQKAQTGGATGQAPTAAPAPAAQTIPEQTQDTWGPYRVPIPQQYQHYFQVGEQPRG